MSLCETTRFVREALVTRAELQVDAVADSYIPYSILEIRSMYTIRTPDSTRLLGKVELPNQSTHF